MILNDWAELTYKSILEGVVLVKRSETTKSKLFALIQVLSLLAIFLFIVAAIVVREVVLFAFRILECVLILTVAAVVWLLSKLGVF